MISCPATTRCTATSCLIEPELERERIQKSNQTFPWHFESLVNLGSEVEAGVISDPSFDRDNEINMRWHLHFVLLRSHHGIERAASAVIARPAEDLLRKLQSSFTGSAQQMHGAGHAESVNPGAFCCRRNSADGNDQAGLICRFPTGGSRNEPRASASLVMSSTSSGCGQYADCSLSDSILKPLKQAFGNA